jgi:hypothetical protein
MSIDISSVIPVIHPIDIRVNKEEDSQVVRAVEESSESGGSELQLNREGFTEIIRDNLTGVGDTYSTKGELIKEYGSRSNSENKNMTIDMRI